MKPYFFMSMLMYMTGWKAASVVKIQDTYEFTPDEAKLINTYLRRLEALENETAD